MKDAILSGLAPLKVEARERGHYLHCRYQDIWFSPDELDAQNADGKFIWSAENWTVRDPKDRTVYLEHALESAKKALAQWKAETNT